jgi:hypothetical protein
MRSYTIDNSAPPLTPPMCAACGKRCDSVTETYDEFMARVVFIAECHGERERVTIDKYELEALERVDVSMGQAFTSSTKRLAP